MSAGVRYSPGLLKFEADTLKVPSTQDGEMEQ